MRLEYFQMIDRIAALDVEARSIRSVCHVPQREHDLRRPLSGLSADAGRAADRMHGADDRLAGDGARGFAAMPFLAAVKEAKFRTAVFPGDELEFEGKVVHEGSGFTVGECKGRRKGQSHLRSADHLSRDAVSESGIPRGHRFGARPNSTFPVKELSK